MLRIAVLASGRGTNFQALHDSCASGYLDAEIACVLTNKRNAGVVERAERAGVEVLVLPHKGRDTLEVDEDIVRAFEERDVGLVCNAGYSRIRGAVYCKAFDGRAMNVHPSLLPAFPGGMHAIQDAWEWGVKTSGVTVHYATEDLDAGPIIIQRAVDIAPDDTLETFEEKIHLVEYAIYPKAVRLFAERRLRIEGRTVVVDGDVPEVPWSGALPPGLS